ncbi:hypothetical protein J5N97_017369 [Dioscorea zingiberensis]|uniref:Uncharacterized protein n=1 Tax=Dioscorea zingiberensis TaxID=325984 RepID=A0A9D5CLX6_9LILI|nr:hypothetical protein J5N97_017369 [Dioscorea zingiberensis]
MILREVCWWRGHHSGTKSPLGSTCLVNKLTAQKQPFKSTEQRRYFGWFLLRRSSGRPDLLEIREESIIQLGACSFQSSDRHFLEITLFFEFQIEPEK